MTVSGIIKEERKLLQRWEEYFKELLNIEKEEGIRTIKKKQEQKEE
jgi:hypothetical protein